MHKQITLILKITVLSLLHSPLFAQSYYIDAKMGNDRNSGISPNSAWQTIDQVNCAISKATIDPSDNSNCKKIKGKAKPLDKFLFKRGGVFLNSTLDIDLSNNLGFSAYGKGAKPIISYDTPLNINVITDDNRKGLALGITDSQNIRIRDIEFQGGWASIMLTDSSNIKLFKLNVGKNSQYGIVINESNPNFINHHIEINQCNIKSHFSFPYTYSDSMEKRTEDGIVVYAMENSKIINNFFNNWGHASINIDAEERGREIRGNIISRNYLTSPDVAYGGRISLDDAHDNKILMNVIANTSVSSQLGGYKNEYNNNLFLNTHVPPEGVKDNDGALRVANNTAILIEAYADKDIYENKYLNNRIINSEGVGLKISDAGDYEIRENIFKNNFFSGCGFGEQSNNISIVIEDNSESASYSNIYKSNQIINREKKTILFRGEKMDVQKFNRQNSHDDQIKNNIGVRL